MNNQAYLFVMFILNGILIGILFDCFRILRRSFKTSDWITYIEDIVFWICTGILTLYFIFVFNNGEIRFYIFLGIILGIAFYLLTISKYFIAINVKIITCIKTVIEKIFHVIIFPFKFLLRMIKKTFLRTDFFCFY